jgi:hypothetical protein
MGLKYHNWAYLIQYIEDQQQKLYEERVEIASDWVGSIEYYIQCQLLEKIAIIL